MRVGCGRVVDPRRLVAHEQPVAGEGVVQAGADAGVVLFGERLVDLAVEGAVARIDETARVAERAPDASSAHLARRRPIIALKNPDVATRAPLTVLTTPRKLATSTCRMRLPA